MGAEPKEIANQQGKKSKSNDEASKKGSQDGAECGGSTVRGTGDTVPVSSYASLDEPQGTYYHLHESLSTRME